MRTGAIGAAQESSMLNSCVGIGRGDIRQGEKEREDRREKGGRKRDGKRKGSEREKGADGKRRGRVLAPGSRGSGPLLATKVAELPYRDVTTVA